MPGTTISRKFETPSRGDFWSMVHIYSEYLIIRLSDFGLTTGITLKFISRLPQTDQPNSPWIDRLTQACNELQKQTCKPVIKIRRWISNREIDRWSPYDAAAWDRFFETKTPSVSLHLPKIEMALKSLEAVIDERNWNPSDPFGERLLEHVNTCGSAYHNQLHVLRHLLTAEGAEAYHAGLLRGERLDFKDV